VSKTFAEGRTMTITVNAVYENGTLKLASPVPLKEHQQVRVTIETTTSWVEQTYGILGWKGTAEEAERFALDVDLEYPPPEAP
jgi:predicted DNA-binding antitoxin AbrB/MazE fold protein